MHAMRRPAPATATDRTITSAFVCPAVPRRLAPRSHLPLARLRRSTTTTSLAPPNGALGMTAGFDAAPSSLLLASALPDGVAAAALAVAVTAGLLLYRVLSRGLVFPGPDVTAVVVPAAPGRTARRPPLLFVHGCAHGGFVFASLARELARRGYESHLLTLPKSRFKSLRAYAADIGGYVRDELGEGPVLVGHSQGAAEAMHYLLNGDADAPAGARATAGVFLAPASAEGAGAIAAGLVRRHPAAALRAVATFNGAEAVGVGDPATMAATLFAPGTTATAACGTEESLAAYAARLSPVDSCRVFADLALHRLLRRDRSSPAGLGIPVLVLAAERDGIIPEAASDAVAARWGVTGVTAEGQGHCFADPGWEGAVVPPLVEWLDANVPDAARDDG